MYLCKDCGELFEEPHYLFGEPGCPFCRGQAYEKALICDSCGSYIQGEYIKTKDHGFYCFSCYIIKNTYEEYEE